jgi:hypothetical protein
VISAADDARDFPEVERRYVRGLGVDFDWMTFDTPSPRLPLPVPLHNARVALISTAGGHPVGPSPFTRPGIASVTPVTEPVMFTHIGFDTERAARDPDVVWPARSLQRLAHEGTIGDLCSNAISMMGAVFDGNHVLERAVGPTVDQLRSDRADLALLVPA